MTRIQTLLPWHVILTTLLTGVWCGTMSQSTIQSMTLLEDGRNVKNPSTLRIGKRNDTDRQRYILPLTLRTFPFPMNLAFQPHTSTFHKPSTLSLDRILAFSRGGGGKRGKNEIVEEKKGEKGKRKRKSTGKKDKQYHRTIIQGGNKQSISISPQERKNKTSLHPQKRKTQGIKTVPDTRTERKKKTKKRKSPMTNTRSTTPIPLHETIHPISKAQETILVTAKSKTKTNTLQKRRRKKTQTGKTKQSDSHTNTKPTITSTHSRRHTPRLSNHTSSSSSSSSSSVSLMKSQSIPSEISSLPNKNSRKRKQTVPQNKVSILPSSSLQVSNPPFHPKKTDTPTKRKRKRKTTIPIETNDIMVHTRESTNTTTEIRVPLSKDKQTKTPELHIPSLVQDSNLSQQDTLLPSVSKEQALHEMERIQEDDFMVSTLSIPSTSPPQLDTIVADPVVSASIHGTDTPKKRKKRRKITVPIETDDIMVYRTESTNTTTEIRVQPPKDKETKTPDLYIPSLVQERQDTFLPSVSEEQTLHEMESSQDNDFMVSTLSIPSTSPEADMTVVSATTNEEKDSHIMHEAFHEWNETSVSEVQELNESESIQEDDFMVSAMSIPSKASEADMKAADTVGSASTNANKNSLMDEVFQASNELGYSKGFEEDGNKDLRMSHDDRIHLDGSLTHDSLEMNMTLIEDENADNDGSTNHSYIDTIFSSNKVLIDKDRTNAGSALEKRFHGTTFHEDDDSMHNISVVDICEMETVNQSITKEESDDDDGGINLNVSSHGEQPEKSSQHAGKEKDNENGVNDTSVRGGSDSRISDTNTLTNVMGVTLGNVTVSVEDSEQDRAVCHEFISKYLDDSDSDRNHSITVSVVTWNLGEESPSEKDASFIKRFRYNPPASKGLSKTEGGSDIVLIGCQETENTKPRRTEGHRSQEIRRLMIKMLGKRYIPLALHSLGGVQLGLFCKRTMLHDIQSVSIADVACGVGNVFHNKGAIGAFVQLKARNDKNDQLRDSSVKILFIVSHLAAHVKNVDARNADYWRIVSELEAGAPVRFLSPNPNNGNDSIGGLHLIRSMDHVFFCGDLNYRLDLPREFTEQVLRDMNHLQSIKGRGAFDTVDKPQLMKDLLRHDQLLRTLSEGSAFHDLTEGKIMFPPTFKFDKGTSLYDTSHKQRIPAWTDRILFKPFGVRVLEYNSVQDAQHSDHRPVFASFVANMMGRLRADSSKLAKSKSTKEVILKNATIRSTETSNTAGSRTVRQKRKRVKTGETGRSL